MVSFLLTLPVLEMSGPAWTEQPCDRYPANEQAR